MSLAPASSRGFFLNARLAVNGIQCAARSFGTLTAGRAGLLSSILASYFWQSGFARHASSFACLAKPTMPRIIAGQRGGFVEATVSRYPSPRLRWGGSAETPSVGGGGGGSYGLRATKT